MNELGLSCFSFLGEVWMLYERAVREEQSHTRLYSGRRFWWQVGSSACNLDYFSLFFSPPNDVKSWSARVSYVIAFSPSLNLCITRLQLQRIQGIKGVMTLFITAVGFRRGGFRAVFGSGEGVGVQ